ncbi:MAG: protein arginine kinase [Phycisphaerales bacterium]|nr:protein arginine kinase [Phycisphaerales bacterium]MCB9835435.1 protein arginine kinase [Phycisphaera sp.]
MKQILEQTPAWLSGGGEHADVVLSSRVRLARNIAGFRFVGRADVQERRDVFNLVRKNLTKAGIVSEDLGSGGACWLDVSAIDQYERDALSERQCISRQHAKGHKTSANEGPDPRAVIVQTPSETVTIMVNEEDHLRLRAVRPGLMLREALEEINAVDDQVESVLEYAFSSRFGYLTACPTNVGTGVRVSVMMHLPALRVLGEIDRVKRAASDMSLALRGFWGEGSEADGDFYQLSNQTTLGKSEELILTELAGTIVPKVIEYERRAREKLMTQRREFTEDLIYRALGVLTHARRIAADEAMSKLSEVRLGVTLGLLNGPDVATVNRLLLMVQQAHLQHAVGRVLDPSERKAARATLLRQTLS